MAENEGQAESQEQQPGRRFSQEQYDMLMRCSKKKDMTEWNQWREEHQDEEILLEGAHLKKAFLFGFHLENAYLVGAHLEEAYLFRAHLEGTDLQEAHLEGACLEDAHLEHARLQKAHLEGADFLGAHLEGALFEGAYLEGVDLSETDLEGVFLEGSYLKGVNLFEAPLKGTDLTENHLEGAYLRRANLEGAYFEFTHLEGADLTEAHLEGALFLDCNLEGANFSGAIINGETLLNEDCKVDRNTKFEAVGLDSMRIYPATKQLLEYNIRRMNWEDWYWGNKAHKVFKRFVTKKELLLGACYVVGHLLLTSPIRLFWSMSDYGLKTKRIIAWFFGLAVTFAIAYRSWPNCVLVNGQVGDIRGFVHALYFSVVTMTTLGFGDIAANPDSWQGQVLLMVQVTLGYVLLGALVTRFAVLFTAGGPVGKFTPMSRETKKMIKRLEKERRGI